jgi:hypothetical protein
MGLTKKPYKNWSNALSNRITLDEWVDTYQPVINPNNDWGGGYSSFETYGDDLQYILQQDDKHIWTEIEHDEGVTIVAGYHLVNRLQYFITIKPWTDDVEVPISIDKECDCMSYGDAKIDCSECNGNGYITIYIDTREELEQVYGPQNV